MPQLDLFSFCSSVVSFGLFFSVFLGISLISLYGIAARLKVVRIAFLNRFGSRTVRVGAYCLQGYTRFLLLREGLVYGVVRWLL